MCASEHWAAVPHLWYPSRGFLRTCSVVCVFPLPSNHHGCMRLLLFRGVWDIPTFFSWNKKHFQMFRLIFPLSNNHPPPRSPSKLQQVNMYIHMSISFTRWVNMLNITTLPCLWPPIKALSYMDPGLTPPFSRRLQHGFPTKYHHISAPVFVTNPLPKNKAPFNMDPVKHAKDHQISTHVSDPPFFWSKIPLGWTLACFHNLLEARGMVGGSCGCLSRLRDGPDFSSQEKSRPGPSVPSAVLDMKIYFSPDCTMIWFMISDSPVIGTQPIEFKRKCLFNIFIKNEWLDFDTKHLYRMVWRFLPRSSRSQNVSTKSLLIFCPLVRQRPRVQWLHSWCSNGVGHQPAIYHQCEAPQDVLHEKHSPVRLFFNKRFLSLGMSLPRDSRNPRFLNLVKNRSSLAERCDYFFLQFQIKR